VHGYVRHRTGIGGDDRYGHLSHAEIGRLVGLAVSSVNERIRKLVQRGIIAGWTARLDPASLGLDLLAFVYVLIDKPENSPAFLEVVAQTHCHVASDVDELRGILPEARWQTWQPHLPIRGLQYGQHFLNVQFATSKVRVPFRIFTKDEEKIIQKNWKDIKKQVEEAFKKGGGK